MELPPDSDGWNNTDVMVSFVCKDNESGIKECSQSIKLDKESKGHIIKAMAVDKVGNTRTLEEMVNINKTPP